VWWMGFVKLTFDFRGEAAIYRYWDATACGTFIMEMARNALEVELREEAAFLEWYDAVYRAVDERFDIRGSDLANLVMMCLTNDGLVSKHRRKQYQYTVPTEVFDYIEQTAQQVLSEQRAVQEERQ